MPNIASIFKAEISRVARKEVRVEVESIRKLSSQQRSSLAALRRQVETLQKEVRRLDKQGGTTTPPAITPSSVAGDGPRRRFSPDRLAAHRAKLKLSAAAYGRLLGMSSQTIYNWEQGKSRPNAEQIHQLAALKDAPASAVLQQLEDTSKV